MVDMPLESIQDVEELILRKKLTDKEYSEILDWMVSGYEGDTTWKNIKPHLDNLSQDYRNKINKIKELESKMEKIETASSIITENFEKLEKKVKLLLEENKQQKKEVENLRKENHRLKIISGEAKSDWTLEKNLLYRNNPLTGELEQYWVPFEFDYSKVTYPKFYFNDDGVKCIQFDHDKREFKLPYDVYLWLRGELPEQKKDKAKKIDSIEIKEYDDLTKHIGLFDFSEYSYRKLDNVFKFLKEHKGKTFQRQYFTGNCDISPRTVSKYLKMLEECKLIIKLPSRGKYKVNIK